MNGYHSNFLNFVTPINCCIIAIAMNNYHDDTPILQKNIRGGETPLNQSNSHDNDISQTPYRGTRCGRL